MPSVSPSKPRRVAAPHARGDSGAGRQPVRSGPKLSPIGLALAGGGPLGAMYELGALTALAEALEGIDFNDLDVYVGVSSGGFLAAGLANGIAPAQMCRMFIDFYQRKD